MSEINVAILGAGPAGLTAGCILASEGIKVHVYEAAGFVGGLAKTKSVLNEEVEAGPHFFRSHYFSELRERIPALQAIKYREFARSSKILFKKKHFNYPPDVKNIFRNISMRDLSLYGLSF